MKLHTIEIENLNSLYGTHTIALDKDFADAPLYLIHGPTGAGKSTILDAISLALFGRTPRLDVRTGRPETNTEHIMSHGTGSCRALVEFSVRRGAGTYVRYRAQWSCHRARNKADGNIQRPVRSLERLEPDGDWTVLANDNRFSYYEKAFDDALAGLTVDDFRRSIMLAQGDFSRFLFASEDAKAVILERLTSTDVYRDIGHRAAERYRATRRALEEATGAIGHIEVLDTEGLATLQADLDAAREQVATMRARLERIGAERTWLTTRADLEVELTAAAESLDAHARALEARADDLERQREDERCRVAEPTLTEARRLADAVRALEEQLPALAEEHHDAEAALTKAGEAQQVALEALQKALDDHEKLRPELNRARELRAELAAATAERNAATGRRDDAARALDDARRRLDGLRTEHDAARTTLDDATARLETLTHARPIREHLADWQTRAAHLFERQTEAGRLEDRIAAADAELTKLEASAIAHTRTLDTARARIAPLEAALDEARAALAETLDGAPDAAARHADLDRNLQAIDARIAALREATSLTKQHADLDRQRKTEAAAITGADRALSGLDKEIGDAEKSYKNERDTYEKLQDLIETTRLALKYADARRELLPGAPCPVCGGIDHPYRALAADAAVDEAEANLRAKLVKHEIDKTNSAGTIEDARRALEALRARQAAASASRSGALERLAALDERADALGAALATALSAAGVSPNAVAADDALLPAWLEREHRRRESTAAALRTLQQRVDAARAAEDAHREALAAVSDAEAALRTCTERKNTVGAARAEHAAAHAELVAGVAARTRDLVEALVACAIVVPQAEGGAPDLAAALASAATLLANFDRAQTERDAAARALEALATAIATAEEALANKTAAHAEATDAHAARTARVAELRKATAACLDGRDPATLEDELIAATAAARRAHEAAQSVATDARAALSQRATRLEQAREHLEAERAALRAIEARLNAELDALGLPDAAALAARLLPEGVRRALRTELDALTIAHRTAHSVHAGIDERLARHLEAVPEGFDPKSASLADLEEQHTAADEAFSLGQQTLGRLQSTLERDEHNRALRASRLEEIEALERDHDTWRQIYDLIGIGDGERFRRFAQSLNLQSLVDQASAWLAKLYPRYSLSVARTDEDPFQLAFAILDHENANHARPITTLSGGETFLVSLALALALADFRHVRLPIETLLLDEGFGTLDAETLTMALDVLTTLQRDSGRQIGIISHVEELKERVQHRLVVEKLTNGRSRIRAEGPTPHPI